MTLKKHSSVAKVAYILAVALISCLFFVACNNSVGPGEHTAELDNFEIGSSLQNDYEYDYAEFDLGQKTYTTASGHTMPYNVRGVMAVPKGEGKFPLAVIIHGLHEELDETKRFDTGFDYLVKALAQNGYAAVSLDMLKPYIQSYGGNDDYVEKMVVIVDNHFQSLAAANEGGVIYPMDVTNKIDLDRVAILGHSRSGAAIFQVAKSQMDKGVGVSALLSLAPAADFWHDFPNLPVAFLIPQYDGDVVQLEGIIMYDYLQNRITGDKSATMLMGANHNFFNRNVERDDSIARRVPNAYTPLTRQEHEDFLANFAVDFFNASFGGDDRFYQTNQPQPNRMYGRDVTRQLHKGKPVVLANVNTADSFTGAGALVEHAVDSVVYFEDQVLINTATTQILQTILDGTKNHDEIEYTSVNRDLIRIEWNQPGEGVAITPLVSDFSGKSSLNIALVVDSASELNAPGQGHQMTVTLRDSAGNSAKVTTAPNQNAIMPYPGEHGETPLDGFTIYYWEPTTPLGMVSIPLGYFEGLDLTTVQTIELSFGAGERGAVYIGSLTLQ